MEEKDIVRNEYLRIFQKSDEAYIETYKKGFKLEMISKMLSSYPQIVITNFGVFRNSILEAPAEAQKFGKIKESIEIRISDDEMRATIVYNLPQEELKIENREQLIHKTSIQLSKMGIIFGIRHEIFEGEIQNGKEYVIAEGVPPVNGNDAIIKMYEIEEPTPKVNDDQTVDYYDLKLINRVKIGDWLGEKIEATEGVPGKTVRGRAVNPIKGRNYPLLYDRRTIQAIYDNNKTVLYSKINGAVCYRHGEISVCNNLEIDGDVNLSTGNIKFDGCVTISGTVLDGFSVEATGDIEINSTIGLGNVKSIISTGGSIFIKGGIASKGNTEIRAAKNIYTKFIDNSEVSCEGTAHIGYYSINSTIRANRIIFDSAGATQIGGHSIAKYQICLPILGSVIEKTTCVEVTGFDRKSLEKEIEEINYHIEVLKKRQKNLNMKLSKYDSLPCLDSSQENDYKKLVKDLFENKNDVRNLELKRKEYLNYLKTKGEGEIAITKKIYPKSVIILCGKTLNMKTTELASTFYFQNGEIKQI